MGFPLGFLKKTVKIPYSLICCILKSAYLLGLFALSCSVMCWPCGDCRQYCRDLLPSCVISLWPGEETQLLDEEAETALDPKKIMVISRKAKYQQDVMKLLEEICRKGDMSYTVDGSLIESPEVIATKSLTFGGASMVIMVAVPEPRMMLISDQEDSQLGRYYFAAIKKKASVFVILLAHKESESLDEEELYHSSLEATFRFQPELEKCIEDSRFISVANDSIYNTFNLSRKQEDTLVSWIKEISKKNNYGSCV